ncbi:hypothetical protein B0O80DRAFT_444146 [Mortierella sp. GBAus27b]|nr:hypothetical protein B0O80DRAFT_444146 [Mortierella sp. GBAus27b]
MHDDVSVQYLQLSSRELSADLIHRQWVPSVCLIGPFLKMLQLLCHVVHLLSKLLSVSARCVFGFLYNLHHLLLHTCCPLKNLFNLMLHLLCLLLQLSKLILLVHVTLRLAL